MPNEARDSLRQASEWLLGLVMLFSSASALGAVTAEDLLTEQTLWAVEVDSKAAVKPDQVQRDIDVLIYAFREAYGGYRFLPSEIVAKTEDALSKLAVEGKGDDLTAGDLCRAIDSILDRVPDAHLRANLPKFRCSERQERKGSVGPNIAADAEAKDHKPWRFLRTRQNGKNIGVLGITRFLPSKDASWNGFDVAIDELLASKAIIIDLRGNHGGDDSKGLHLAARLYGGAAPIQAEERIRRQTPASFAVLINGSRSALQWRKSTGGDSKPQEDLIQEFGEKFQLAKAGKLPPESSDHLEHKRNTDVHGQRYQGPIYLLADADCGSSGESTLDALMSHPNAKVVGENTAGLLHFGEVGTVLLPNSKIRVQMGTQFIRYKDNRIYEKTGIAPKIGLRPGTDALMFVQSEIEHAK